MQRWFSVFPTGSPGLGLLMLRLVLGTYVVWESLPLVRSVAIAAEMSLSSAAVGTTLAFGGGLAIIGLFTPLSQTAVALVHIGLFVESLASQGQMSGGAWSSVLIAGIAGSLALLGPGAYSVDASLFGRHEIDIPPR